MTDDLISSRASLAKAMMILMGGLYTTDSLPDCRISLEGKAWLSHLCHQLRC